MLAEQVLALIIFISMFVLIVLDKIERHYVTLGCGALTLIGVFGIIMKSPEAVISILNLRSIFTSGFWYQSGAAEEAVTGINWSTIIKINGVGTSVIPTSANTGTPDFSDGCVCFWLRLYTIVQEHCLLHL